MKRLLSVSACLTILLWSCSFYSDRNGQAEDIIYTVGSFNATRYELDQAFENFVRSHTSINDRSLESWMGEIRMRAYFLADAYARRYDTLSVIQKKLDLAFKYKIAQEGGYLWKRDVAPRLQVNNPEIKDAYTKRADLYYVDLLFFSDELLLQDVAKHFSAGSSPTFDALTKQFRGRPGVEFVSVPLLYPFSQLASVKDEIYQMNVGDILGPIVEPEGTYIIHLNRKEKKEFVSMEADRQYIEQDLIAFKRKMAIDSKQDSIYRTSKLAFRNHNIERLAQWLKDKKETSAEIDTTVLMTYYLANSQYRFLAKDYGELIKYAPILVGDFKEAQQIRNNLKDHLIRLYLYEEARQIGILNDKIFLLDKNQYYKALLEQRYYAEEFERKVQISEQDLIDYYNKNQSSFPAEQVAWVSFIELANESVAYDALSYFQSVLARGGLPQLSDTTAMQGLLDIKEPELINGTNTAWGEENRKQFVSAKVNTLLGPIMHNNRVYLYYVSKKETENVKEFSAVREKVRARLKLARIEELKIKRLKDLKTQFPEDDDGLIAYCKAKKDK